MLATADDRYRAGFECFNHVGLNYGGTSFGLFL